MNRRAVLTYSIVLFIFLFTTQNIFSQFRIKFEPPECKISEELKSEIQTKFFEEFQLIMGKNGNSIQTISLGQVDSVFYTAWDFAKPNNQITDVVEKRKIYDYDKKTRTRVEIEADYNNSTGEYENATKIEKIENENYQALDDRETTYSWDENQKDWVPESEVEYVYDEARTSSETYYEFDNGQKIPVSRESVVYGEVGERLEELSEIYENGSWKNSRRTVYNWDDEFEILKTEQIWNPNTNTWENLEKEEKSYNEKGQEDSFTTSYWDGSAWLNETYGEHDYNQDDYLARTTISFWNGAGWDFAARTIYSYLNSTEYLQTLIDMYWDAGQNSWQNNWSTNYSYNSDYQLTQDLLQQWNGSSWDYYSKDEYNYDADGNCTSGTANMYYQGNWEDTYHPLGFQDGYGLYHYFLCSYFNAFFSQLTDVEEDEVRHNFSLEQNYPNPFNPTTSIQYRVPSIEKVSLKVYDILGRELKTLVNEVKAAGIYEINFDAAQLPSGVYFYTLRSSNYRNTKKMVLLR